MDTNHLYSFLGVNSIFIVILGFFIRMWIVRLGKDIEKLEEKLEVKVDNVLCTERMETEKNVIKDNTKNNKEEHNEIFERLRKVESIRGL